MERPVDPALTLHDPLPGCWALVEGLRNGRRMSIACTLNAWPPFKMGGGTGYALAAGLSMMLEGLVVQTGVVTPESVLDPMTFFDRLALMVEPVRADGAALVELTERSGSATV